MEQQTQDQPSNQPSNQNQNQNPVQVKVQIQKASIITKSIISFTISIIYSILIQLVLSKYNLILNHEEFKLTSSSIGLSILESILIFSFSFHLKSNSTYSLIYGLSLTLTLLKLPLFTLVYRYFSIISISNLMSILIIDTLSYFGQFIIHLKIFHLNRFNQSHSQIQLGLSDPFMLILSLGLVSLIGGLFDYVSDRLILRSHLQTDLDLANHRANLNDYFLLEKSNITNNQLLPAPRMLIIQLSSMISVTIPIWLMSSFSIGSTWILILILSILQYLIKLPISFKTTQIMISLIMIRLVGSNLILNYLIDESRKEDKIDHVIEEIVEKEKIDEIDEMVDVREKEKVDGIDLN
ncbi:hypothetical protein DFH28DRAFT_968466 [Melampsora americana]|nr:hypothetical protein DFH28DRAFT_968466 [Melampsora americana]